MSSSLAPAAPPDTVPSETNPSPGILPGRDEIPPITAPVIPIQTPAAPAPAAVPPVLPVVVQTTPPSISPVVLPLPLQAPPLPQTPVIPAMPPVIKDIPPPEITASPPSSSPPVDVPGIVTQTPPFSQPPLLTSPPSLEPDITLPGPLKPNPASPPLPTVTQPKSRPVSTKPDPLKPGPSSQIPTVTRPKSRPVTTKPDPLKHGPSSPNFPAARQTKTNPITTKPDPLKPGPSSPNIPAGRPIAASAVFPSQPPVALPVPQTPHGGAWFPSMSTPPSIQPTFPGSTPAVENTPFFGASSSTSSSSSLVPADGGTHQNIEASVHSSTGGSSVFVVGLVVGGVLLLLFAAVVCILLFFCRKKQNKFDDHSETDKMHPDSFRGIEDKTLLPLYTKPGPNTPIHQPPVNTTTLTHLSSGTFAYDELAAATGGFSDHNLLGEGGFGCVYKGVLPNGKEVAVKQLKMGGHQGEREFRAEVDTISQVHHKHLVSLVGYCISGIERLLVYEFVDNNTLDFHLHGKEQPVMDWPTRLKIAIGSAKGLAYLHEDCSPSIIHRDIKAANILLDSNSEAKVSDFGLAKIFSSKNPSVTHMTTRVVGTFGYLAPEYASSGKVTDKSDVYSYGVVLLELITGRTPLSNFGPATNGNLVNWARPFLTQAIADGKYDTLADSRLENNYNVNEMASMVSCAAACVRLSSWRRPRMSQVIRALEGNLSASELDGGTKAGHSLMHFPYESLDFDPRNYIEDMKRMALASSTYSDNTSEDYGLNLSVSSSDTSHHIC